MGAEITVNSADINLTKEDLANLHDRGTRRYKRYDRLMRHKRIWAVLNYAKCINAIYNSNNFYDLDKAILDYHNAVAKFDYSDCRPSENDILCAFRFCDIQNYIGKCEHRLTEEEKRSISNWSSYTLDYVNILNAVSKRFKTYWDEALDTYNKKNAYLNRLEYLISHLDEVKHRNGLSTIPQIECYINKLKAYYIGMKSTSLNGRCPASNETLES